MPKWKVERVRKDIQEKVMITKDDTGRRKSITKRKSTLRKKKTQAAIEEVEEEEEVDMS